MDKDENIIARLEAEFEELQFDRFGFEDAWAIGCDLVSAGKDANLAIAVDITVNGQVLFHAALPGSSPDNDQWILRKNRIVARFHKSSFYIANRLKREDGMLDAKYGLSLADFAPFGGAVPVRIRHVGVVGTITVSGLPDREDHALVVKAVRKRLSDLKD